MFSFILVISLVSAAPIPTTSTLSPPTGVRHYAFLVTLSLFLPFMPAEIIPRRQSATTSRVNGEGVRR